MTHKKIIKNAAEKILLNISSSNLDLLMQRKNDKYILDTLIHEFGIKYDENYFDNTEDDIHDVYHEIKSELYKKYSKIELNQENIKSLTDWQFNLVLNSYISKIDEYLENKEKEKRQAIFNNPVINKIKQDYKNYLETLHINDLMLMVKYDYDENEDDISFDTEKGYIDYLIKKCFT